jgi:hypothetical protein
VLSAYIAAGQAQGEIVFKTSAGQAQGEIGLIQYSSRTGPRGKIVSKKASWQN